MSGSERTQAWTPPQMRGCSCWWSSHCAGLLDRGREEALSSRGAPAAQGCSIEGGGEAALAGGDPAARGSLIERGRNLFLMELPLMRGAARLREGGGSI